MARYVYDKNYSLEFFEAAIDRRRQLVPEANQYGYALALLRNDKPKEAKKIIDGLRASDPDNLFYIDTATDILIALNKPEIAIKMLSERLEKSPRNAVVTLNLANAAIEAEKYDTATSVLRDFLLVHPDHFLSHQLLADAYGSTSQYLEMHQTNAEMYALAASFPRAIDELQHAYNFTEDNHLEKQRIRARIQQLRDEQARLERLL
jgi:predicted Zn-dependent protease